jgi:hypothetical protein
MNKLEVAKFERRRDCPLPKLIPEAPEDAPWTDRACVIVPVEVFDLIVAAFDKYFWIKFVVVVKGTDPVTYEETWSEPVGTRSARTYALPEASEVTVTLPTKEVFPLTVKVSVSAEGLTPPMPTAPPW